MIAIDSPKTLRPEDTRVRVTGWCNDEHRPERVRVGVDGWIQEAKTKPAPNIDQVYPQLRAVAYECELDFAEIYRSGKARYSNEIFSVVVMIDCGAEQRAFEYTVPQEWVASVFAGRPAPRAKPRTPDHLMIRVSGSCDISFYPTGHIALGQMRALLAKTGRSIDDFQSILDFGCGCGRVLLALHNERVPARLCGSDIDQEAMAWCRENFSPVATFDANPHLPPTRYADETFDFIYAISVFTHLPEDHQFAWLAELNRILKPGGILITTVHGPTTCASLPRAVRAEVQKRGFLYIDQSHPDWPPYLGAVTEGLPDFYRLTYHTFDYVREKWRDFFEIVAIEERGLNFIQDGIVCRKRDASLGRRVRNWFGRR